MRQRRCSVNGKPVTVIGNGACQNNRNITAVVIPEGVTQIGNSAFYDCNNLVDVSFPSTLRVLGSSAFAYCSYRISTSRFVLPDLLESIACTGSTSDTFHDCGAIKIVTPGSPTALLLSDFSGFNTVNENAYKKQWFPFDGCEDCRYLYFTENGVPALYLMKYLGTAAEFSIPAAANTVPDVIADNAFRSCATLTKLTIPEGVKTIGSYAFYECTALTDITFPESLAELGSNAFTNCGQNATTPFSFRLPDHISAVSMTNSTTDTFSNCKAVRIVTPGSDTAFLFSEKFRLNNPPNPDAAYPYYWFTFPGSQHQDLRYLYFDDTVNSVSVRVLHLIKYLGSAASVSIPAQAESLPVLGVIEAKAFQGNTALTSLVIPNGVTRFGRAAFADCSFLTDIAFPQTLKVLGENVFSGCGKVWHQQNINNTENNNGVYTFHLPPNIEDFVYQNSSLDTFHDCPANLTWDPGSTTSYTFRNKGYLQ